MRFFSRIVRCRSEVFASGFTNYNDNLNKAGHILESRDSVTVATGRGLRRWRSIGCSPESYSLFRFIESVLLLLVQSNISLEGSTTQTERVRLEELMGLAVISSASLQPSAYLVEKLTSSHSFSEDVVAVTTLSSEHLQLGDSLLGNLNNISHQTSLNTNPS